MALGAGGVGLLGGRTLSERSNVTAARSSIRFPKAAHPVPPLPSGVDFHIKGLSSFVTPDSSFYRVDTALILPQVAPQTWQLRIHGMVDSYFTSNYPRAAEAAADRGLDHLVLCLEPGRRPVHRERKVARRQPR